MQRISTKKLSRAGIIASLYVVLSLVVFPISSGVIQFRASELLCLLPLIFPEAVPALFVGCMLSNFLTGCAIYDVIIGSLITLFSAFLTYLVGVKLKRKTIKILFSGLFPVILNAFLLPLIWYFCYGEIQYLYIIQVLLLIVSQSIIVYGLGVPTCSLIEKLKKKGISFFE